MFRSITVNKIAALITAIALLTYIVLQYLFPQLNQLNIGLRVLFYIAITLGFFFVLRYFLKEAVFQRINFLYRLFIGKEKSKIVDENSSLDQVSTELARFAFKTKEEIANLKNLSDYRKQYVGNISHELKTPIFSIQGYLHTLLEGGLHDESINEAYLKKALNNLERLQFIVDDLDTINHLENNKDAIKIGTFDVRAQVRKVIAELENLAVDADIKMEYTRGDGGPLMVSADQNRMHQVFYNLLINSLKYGKKGGQTKVHFHNMSDHYLVEVSDNGIGISDEDIPYLFDRFYRVDQSRSRSLGGSGLGLSIVKHVIESHNETLSVTSELDKGTRFTFSIKKA